MSCCGGKASLPSRVETIIKASRLLAEGHRGISALYTTAASDSDEPADKAAFEAAAKLHKEMASKCEEVTVPDNFTTPDGFQEVR